MTAQAKRRIRVAHCLEAVWSGGVEQTRLTLARGLDPERYEQILLCTSAAGELPKAFEAANCRIEVIGDFRFPLDPRPIGAAVRVLQAFKPDIVHGAVFEGVEVAAIAGRLAGARAVIGEETAHPTSRRWKGHALYRLLLTATDRMIGVSPVVSDYLTKTIRYPAARTRTINNGVSDPGAVDPAQVRDIRTRCGVQHGPLIGTVGRLVDHYKKVSVLLQAMPAVRAACPDARLLVVGDGVDAEQLRAQAAALGLSEFVTFAGYQGQTRAFFEAMDIYCHPAAEEAFGLVIVEAMLAGKPVVATRVGGVPGVVSENETALLVPPCKPERLAGALVALAGDPVGMAAMGAAGRARAVARFGPDRYVAEVEEVYRDVLAER